MLLEHLFLSAKKVNIILQKNNGLIKNNGARLKYIFAEIGL